MPDKITIDDLGMIIKQEFVNVHKEFNNVNKRFDGVDNRLKNLEQGQENIELKLTNVAYRFELQELAGRVGYLEEKIEELSKK